MTKSKDSGSSKELKMGVLGIEFDCVSLYLLLNGEGHFKPELGVKLPSKSEKLLEDFSSRMASSLEIFCSLGLSEPSTQACKFYFLHIFQGLSLVRECIRV